MIARIMSVYMMKFIRHKSSASTIRNIQYIHTLENKNTKNKKKYYKSYKKNEKMTVKTQQYCINKAISNTVLDVILSRLASNHIIMTRQESKLRCPTEI